MTQINYVILLGTDSSANRVVMLPDDSDGQYVFASREEAESAIPEILAKTFPARTSARNNLHVVPTLDGEHFGLWKSNFARVVDGFAVVATA